MNKKYARFFVNYWLDLLEGTSSVRIPMGNRYEFIYNTFEAGFKEIGFKMNPDFCFIENCYQALCKGISDISTLGSILYTRLNLLKVNRKINDIRFTQEKAMFIFILNRIKQLTKNSKIQNGEIKEIRLVSEKDSYHDLYKEILTIDNKGNVSIEYLNISDKFLGYKSLKIDEKDANKFLTMIGDYLIMGIVPFDETDDEDNHHYLDTYGLYWDVKFTYYDDNSVYIDSNHFRDFYCQLGEISRQIRSVISAEYLFAFDMDVFDDD